MGLDIVLYGKNGQKLGISEIEESLHESLFAGNPYWRSYPYLRKLRDYYRTNVWLERREIDLFLDELKSMRIRIPEINQTALDQLMDLLSDEQVLKIHIAED